MRRLESRLKELEASHQTEWAVLLAEDPTEESVLAALNAKNLVVITRSMESKQCLLEKVDVIMGKLGLEFAEIKERLCR